MTKKMKNVLITGANKGIGYAIAKRVLEEAEDTVVFLGARDRNRGETAADALRQTEAGSADRVHFVELDVASNASVDRAGLEVRDKSGKEGLYGIVNNAGIGLGAEELRDVVNINTRGIKRVCDTFMPMLNSGGRIVNVTSASGPNFVATCAPEKQAFFTNPHVTWDEIDALLLECEAIAGNTSAFAARGLGDGVAYGLSKACSNAYTVHLAREHPEFVINACTPGFISTDLTSAYVASSGRTAEELGMKTPSEGAASAVFLLFGDPDGSGHYYGSDAKRSPLDRYRAPGSPAYTGD